MADLDDYRDDAENYGADAIETVTEKVAEAKKAVAAFVGTTVIPTLTLWLGADSRIVVAATVLATTLGVYGVTNARKRARR